MIAESTQLWLMGCRQKSNTQLRLSGVEVMGVQGDSRNHVSCWSHASSISKQLLITSPTLNKIMNNLYARLNKEIFPGGSPAKKMEETPPPPPRKISRSRETERPSLPVTEQKKSEETRVESHIQPQVYPQGVKNVLPRVLHRISLVKQKSVLERVRVASGDQYVRGIKFLNALGRLQAKHSWNSLKKSLFLLSFSTSNVTNREFLHLESKNEVGEKAVKVRIAKGSINRQLGAAFSQLRRLFCKKDSRNLTKPLGILVSLCNRVSQRSSRGAFQRLSVVLKSSNPLKYKNLLTTVSKLFHERVSSGFGLLMLLVGSSVPSGQQTRKSRATSSSRFGSARQSPAGRKQPEPPNLLSIETKINAQKLLKKKLSYTQKQRDMLIIAQKEMQTQIEHETFRQQSLLTEIDRKSATLPEPKEVEVATGDQIRVHPDDPIFFKKVRSLYLEIKQIADTTINREVMIRDHNIDFKQLFQHPEYLLTVNRQLKDEVYRVEEVIAPSAGQQQHKPKPKAVSDIIEMKKELCKENEALKKTVQKYTRSAYDTEWLLAEAKKLQEELNKEVYVTSH